MNQLRNMEEDGEEKAGQTRAEPDKISPTAKNCQTIRFFKRSFEQTSERVLRFSLIKQRKLLASATSRLCMHHQNFQWTTLKAKQACKKQRKEATYNGQRLTSEREIKFSRSS